MGQWISVEGQFIEADVIRWEEAVFAKSSRRSRKPTKIGKRRVTAEVLQGPDAGGWVALLVRHCKVLSETVIGQVVEKFKNGSSLRRSQNTILRGKPERLLWSDETARAVVASGSPPRRQVTRPPRPRNSGTTKRSPKRGRNRTRR